MKGIILFCSVLFFTGLTQSQILVGAPETGKEQKKSEPVELKSSDTLKRKAVDGSTSVYFVANWSRTGRSLVPNGDIYGDSLGKRANESTLDVWSFGIGMQNKLTPHLMWDGGISFVRNGESYNFKDVDTTFAYQTYYNYISMPVRLNYTIGNDFKFYAGAGLMPQMFVGYRQESQWTTKENAKDHETFKTKSGYNSFVISALVNIGMIMNFQNHWALIVSPEFRYQLNSSYPKLDGYIHKGRALGVTFGLTRNL